MTRLLGVAAASWQTTRDDHTATALLPPRHMPRKARAGIVRVLASNAEVSRLRGDTRAVPWPTARLSGTHAPPARRPHTSL